MMSGINAVSEIQEDEREEDSRNMATNNTHFTTLADREHPESLTVKAMVSWVPLVGLG
jgi:hypothetical protein